MKYAINLIHKKKEEGFINKIIFFFLNYLRYIFVITQLVIIGVFFYRFKVDQSIVDLKESIGQKQEIIQVVYPLIQEAQNIDMRTKEIRKIIKIQSRTDGILEYVLSIFPEKLYLTNLLLDKDTLRMYGYATDVTQLQSFYQRLKREKKFQLIELKDLKKTENGYMFFFNLGRFNTT